MAEGRDKQSMGNRRELVPAYTLSYSGQQVGAGVWDGWFGPQAPMSPIAPPSARGRMFDYPVGYNQSTRPRAYEPISFEQLRNFADGYDLLRIIIETRKDQLAGLKWAVQVREDFKEQKTKFDAKIAEIKAFLIRPNGEDFWDEWLRMIVEDLLVIDAPAIHRRRTYGGDLVALDPIDGATIKRVLTDAARTPEPPLPAYQQVLKGLPAIDYTTDELLYRPRNKRTHRVYGYSPVEQIVMTVNIALRRQVWQLQSFTEGNIPEALIGVPMEWTPDQIAQFQDWFDAILEGSTAQRRKARFVPGDIAKSFHSTKPEKLFDKEAEEWLARVVCFAFSIAPQPFVSQVNRATAETAHEAALTEGLTPLMKWIKSLIDTVLIDDFETPELEFVWVEQDELDPAVKSQILDREQAAGRMTLNECRKEQGLEPYDHSDADRPMYKITTGWVPALLSPEEQAAKDAAAQALAAAKPPGGDGEAPEDTPEARSDADLPGQPDNKGVAEKSAVPFALPCCGKAGAKLGKAASSKQYVDPTRPEAAKVQKRLRQKLHEALTALGSRVAAQVSMKLKGLGKADDADDADEEIRRLLASLDIEFDSDLKDELEELYSLGGRAALAQLGSRVASDLVDQVNERAANWAEENAASLISGIEDATLDMIRDTIASGLAEGVSTEEISDRLEGSYAFSEDRADLIAETEVTSANSMGALAGYQEAENVGVSIKKSWLILDDACDICQENEDAGPIDLDEPFPSGDDAPGAHPKCRCVLVPEVEDEEGNVTEDEDADVQVDEE